jgi:hypothetical protein
MQIVTATKSKLVLKPSKKDENWKSFIFDIGIIPQEPEPKKLIIQKKVGSYLCSWSISWEKFLEEMCIDTIVILEKAKLNYKSVKV